MKKTLAFVVLAILALSIGAFAQVEVNGSYQFSRAYTNGTVVNTNPGWNASMYVPFHKLGGLGAVTEFSGTDVDLQSIGNVSLNTFGAGLEYKLKTFKRAQPYVSFVVADARFSTDNYSANKLGYQSAGGIDWKMTKHFYLRTGLEYLYTSLPRTTSGVNGIRPIGGVTYRF